MAILGATSGTIDGVPFTVNKGIININGTTPSKNANYYFNSFRVSNSGIATFWIEVTGYIDKPSNNASVLLQESSDKSTWSITKEISCKSTIQKQYQITLDNSKYYRIRFYTSENTFTNATIKIQLEYGTNKTEFEEAGASPSPEFPSEIKSVGDEGTVTIEQRGKNLLKGLSTSLTDSEYWFDVNKYYFTPLEDGWGKFSYDNTSGTSTVFINAQVKLNAINLKPNTQYTIITEFRNSTVSENAGAFFTVTSGNATDVWQAAKTVGYSYINQGKIVKLTATTKEDFTGITTGLATYLRLIAGTSGTVEARISVIEGDYDTTDFEYEPYKSQVVTFPLGEEKLMEGSYLADDGIHHSRKQVVFDGSEIFTIQPQTNETNLYIEVKITDLKPNSVLLSNYFTSGLKLGNNIGIGALFQNYLYFGIPLTTIGATAEDDNSTKTSKFKTWLSTKYANGTPVTVEYELAEPETVPYTAEQQEAWDKIESMKLYDGVNHIESTSEIDIKYNYIYKKPSIKNKSDIENKISSGEYQTIINNKRYFVFLEEELKSVRNDITDRLYIDTNKNIAKVIKRVDKLVLNGTEEWNVNTTHSNVFYTAKPKNMADNETNIFCTITDEFSKDLSGETYGILIDTNINIKIPKVKTVADLKAYLAKEPITIQYKAIEEIKDIILLSKPSSYWTTCEDEFKYPQMQKTTNKRGCVADVIGEEIDVFCKTNKEQFEKIATHKNAAGYAVNRIKKKKWKSIQLKFSSNKSFELFSCTLESYIGSYIKR